MTTRSIATTITLLLAFFFLTAAAYPSESPVTWLVPTEHDFGDIPQDVDVVYEFKFRNDTDRPLVIDNVRMGCGCTSGDWAETPVEPDSTGTLTITYDARNDGYFRKYVKVYFSGERRAQKLWLEGFVEG
ncbi:hypothetical protein CEQ90_02300 [Lewinellaceae bacterium SD302]|nr:hypothetical protein CEQ90_02300 [Lewinellaceae bacterium SD302]